MKKLKESQFAKMITFANSQFQNELYPVDFLVLHPKVYKYPEIFSEHHYIHEDNGKIVGLIGTYPTSYLNLKLLGIGTVCVDEKYRNLGIMKTMFQDLKTDVEPNYDLMYLSGDKVRYEHFGYYKTSRALKFRIKSSYFKNKSMFKVYLKPYLDANIEINQRLYQLYQESTNPVERESDRYFDILKTHFSDIYLIEASDSAYNLNGYDNIIGYIVHKPYNNVITEIVITKRQVDDVIYNFMNLKQLKEVFYEVATDDKNINLIYEMSDDNSIYTLTNLKIINFIKVIENFLKQKKNLKPGTLFLEIAERLILSIVVSEDNIEVYQSEKFTNVDLKLTEKEAHILLFDDFCLFVQGTKLLDINQEKLDLIKSWFPFSLPATFHSIDSI